MVATSWPTDRWPEGVAADVDTSEYEKPLFNVIDEAARDYPNQVYTIFNDGTRTYAQVKDTADRIANFLASAGIRKGDRVAIFLPNLPQYPAIFHGILKAGGVCVTCNPLYTASELNYQLNDSGARMVFCMDHPQFYPTAMEAVKNTSVENVVYCNIKSYLPKVKAILGSLLKKIPQAESHDPSHHSFDDIVAAARPEPPQVSIDPAEDLALIIYTGGTTGKPKGAALTHVNFYYDLKALEEWGRLVHEKGGKPEKLRKGGFHTYLGVLPWYHSFGLTVCMLSAAGSGSKMICVPDPRAGNPPFSEVLKAVQKYKATVMPAVPTIFVAFTNHPDIDKYDLTSLMGCFSGGAPLPPEVCKQFEAKTGAVIFEGYGLSETAPVVSSNPTDRDARKIGTIGLPLPGTDIKIVDLEIGQSELPQGEDGELAVSGPQVMQGYWNRPEENQAVFRQLNGRRYFLTGDIAHIDENGFIVITDRKKDMILVGGFNVYPRDIEDILYQHPKVQLVAVVGVPDDKSGEAVKAFIQVKPGEQVSEQEIRDFCKQNMAGYKRPKFIDFRDDIPVSPVGKVLRRVLRDEEMDQKSE
ncbi:long-chain acyl-CoA synthetase [Desulfosalsimonas propionicica]|uniref:Long-chain acyl-CoA synthetase n=1 Tax=Desulfosalsimonas propionicica TaxID=332175 RepID=A0A7W0C9V8_9BACT|nr:long-chain fatty acid--CoA ligase [Desulfosalsimonas propionicica]MBA2881849.1 long-chain acyl-CoA synthetase [Desulfosalsimonas propionicica]